MFFYRRPAWGIGFRILMVFLLIAGGIAISRSAFRVGFVQGAAAEGVEITAPMFYPHAKGFDFHSAFNFLFRNSLPVSLIINL